MPSPPDTLAHLFRCHTRGRAHRLRELAPNSTLRNDCRCHGSPFPDQQAVGGGARVRSASRRLPPLAGESRQRSRIQKLRSGRSGGRFVQATLFVGVMLLPCSVAASRRSSAGRGCASFFFFSTRRSCCCSDSGAFLCARGCWFAPLTRCARERSLSPRTTTRSASRRGDDPSFP